MSERIWTAALVVIGDEILSGRTQDKNVAQLATWLNVQGIRLAEVRVVPDVTEAIVEAVNILRARNDYLFTTGGIGPTHDDITVDAIAAALDLRVVHHPKALAVLERYYATRGGLTEARKRMARVPEGAELIENRMSGRARYPYRQHLCDGRGAAHHRRHARRADRHARGWPAGRLAHDRLLGCRKRSRDPAGEVERAYAGVAIGSYPFFREGRTGANFVVRATDQALVDACTADLTARLEAGGWPVVADGI